MPATHPEYEEEDRSPVNSMISNKSFGCTFERPILRPWRIVFSHKDRDSGQDIE
jgi:hypothetical protein